MVPCVIVVRDNLLEENILCRDEEHAKKVFLDKLAEYVSNWGDYTQDDINEIMDDGYEKFGHGSVCLSWAIGELSRRVGYKNVGKGANRIDIFERGGRVHIDLRTKLADVLGIDSRTIDSLAEEDRRRFFAEWNAWANEPIRPYLVVRLMAAVYSPVQLPDEIRSVEEAEAYASNVARERHMQCCLVLSRRISVWIEADGSISGATETVPNEPNVPFMRLGGKGGKPCLMKTLDHGIALQQIHWPQREKS